jgi:hypothetical protein
LPRTSTETTRRFQSAGRTFSRHREAGERQEVIETCPPALSLAQIDGESGAGFPLPQGDGK